MDVKVPKQRCAREGCKTKFRPSVSTQRYCTEKCANRASQARLRERAKRTTELEAEQNGAVIGGSNG